MDHRQIAYIVALAVITALTWRQWRLSVVLWINLAITLATVLVADLGHWTYEQGAVRAAVGDLVCAVVLLGMGGHARVLGYLCLPMPICTLGAITMGHGTYDAYTLAYVLGYVQLAVVWVGNGPFSNDRRGSGHRGNHRGGGGFRGIHGGGLLHFAGRDSCATMGLEKGGR